MTDHDPWALMYEDDTAALTDERLAYWLLCGGNVRLPNKQLGLEYLPPGSELERTARAALARLIRKGSLPEFVREMLAALFDPANSTVPVERYIEFKRHARELKRRPEALKSRPEATLEIAMHVWLRHQLDSRKESAVQSAMKQFGLGRRRVFDICRKHKLPKPSRR